MVSHRDSFGLTIKQRLFCEHYLSDKKKMLQKLQEKRGIAMIPLVLFLLKTCKNPQYKNILSHV